MQMQNSFVIGKWEGGGLKYTEQEITVAPTFFYFFLEVRQASLNIKQEATSTLASRTNKYKKMVMEAGLNFLSFGFV